MVGDNHRATVRAIIIEHARAFEKKSKFTCYTGRTWGLGNYMPYK